MSRNGIKFTGAGAANSATPGGLYAEAARDVLRESIRRLMTQALRWHRADIKERTLSRAYEIWKQQRDNETVDEWRTRLRKLKWVDTKPRMAPHRAVKITTGGAKSTIARELVAEYYIPEARRTGAPYGPPFIIAEPPTPHRVLFLVPTHELAYEANRKMPDGVRCAIYQGLMSFKLGTDKEPMCRNLPVVKAAIRLGADVQTTACRRKRRGENEILCPFFADCHYQRMLAECAAADVVFAATDLLFKLPAALGEFGLVIVDESFWQKGLFGVEKAKDDEDLSRLCIAGLAEGLEDYPVMERVEQDGRKAWVASESKTAELRKRIEGLQAALAGEPEGYLRREVIDASSGIGVSPGDLYRICELEWARGNFDHGVRPDASPDECDAAVKRHGFLGQIPLRVEMWKAVFALRWSDEEASGRLVIKKETTKQGTVGWLEISGRRSIDAKLMQLPIIHADATLQFELSKFYLPRLEPAVDLKVDAPHARVTQVIGEPVGITSLRALKPGKRSVKEEERVARKRKRLALLSRELIAGRRGLVICQLAIEDSFRGPNNIETAHFGAIEGRDCWKDVDVLVIIGRQLPWKTALARHAAAISGKPIEEGTVKQERKVGGFKVMCWVCTDPIAEWVRAGIVEAGIEQAHGRARAILRTAADPVEIYLILSDTVVPNMEVDEVIKFQKLKPGPIEEMQERGWLALTSARDACCLFPELFSSALAFRLAAHRARQKLPHERPNVSSPYRKISIRPRNDGALVMRLRYRRQGSPRVEFALVDLIKVPDPRAVLEASFKEKLVSFEVLDGSEPPRRQHRRKVRPVAAVGPSPVPPQE